jgi:hypothetical protein
LEVDWLLWIAAGKFRGGAIEGSDSEYRVRVFAFGQSTGRAAQHPQEQH